MPGATIEDFDDDTDLPLLASTSGSTLAHTGTSGALLEEINDDDPSDELTFDFGKIADQGRQWGEGVKAPAPASGRLDKGKGRQNDGELRPTNNAQGQSQGPAANTPMGGFMGDMMKAQEQEDARIAKLRKQMEGVHVAKDSSMFKNWHTLYPLYFDAKISSNDGRRVARKDAMWWPQSIHIAQACRSLGLPSAHEADKTHPADWANPGRVKVQFEKDGRYMNPIVKNRTQLYKHIANQLQQAQPKLKYIKAIPKAKPLAIAGPVSSKKGKMTKGPSSGTALGSRGKKASSTTKAKGKRVFTPPMARPSIFQPTHPIPHIDDRLPIHSPVIASGIAVAAVKREVEQAKEAKASAAAQGPKALGEGGAAKPKVKKVMVRGKR